MKKSRYRLIGSLKSREQVKAIFSRARLSDTELNNVLNRYMGDSPVPPTWSSRGVKGEFGKTIHSLWSRKIKHRKHDAYRCEKSGHWIHPTVQSIHDFSEDQAEKLKAIYG